MINKTDFLKEIGCSSGRFAKEINELIFNWHKLSHIDTNPNWISDDLFESLHKAALYWKNLVLSEAEGFRDSVGRLSFHKLLKEVIDNQKGINYFGILCPSYKKGVGTVGFADKPGNTTYRAFSNIKRMKENTELIGIKCDIRMFFADISVENSKKLSDEDWRDFDKIIELDAKIAASQGVPFLTLTEFAPELTEIVGRDGKLCDVSDIDVSKKAFDRSIWRDRQFYPKNFGWTEQEADARTTIHAHSYYWQGVSIRRNISYPVMVYSAYDYEKGGLYNGRSGDLWPSIVFPLKDETNPISATIPVWKI